MNRLMKNTLKLLLLFILVQGSVYAAPGDTTWVTVFENRKIEAYGNFDTTAVLPSTSTNYRKIRMHYILGRYKCAPGSQYCGQWDYGTSVYAMPANGDTVKLGRVITPYAGNWALTRTHDYVIDVTDYSSILKGNLGMRYVYEGYSWGFSLTLKIEYIEGTPAQNALEVKNIYDGYYAYGNTSDPIEDRLIAKNYTYNAPAVSAAIKNIISGHGSDATGCGEFCSKYYQQKINGNLVEQKQLWKDDCGFNNIDFQTGTWVYDRANWCPGEEVYPFYHDLRTITSAGTQFSADMDFQAYTSPNPSNAGGYNIASQLITYGAINHAVDASIEDVISPNNDPNHNRANGICDNPMIKIKNVGSTAMTSATIQYQLVGGPPYTFNWTGNLAFNQEEIVDLGSNTALFSGNESNKFMVKVIDVNGQGADENVFNDTYKTNFTHVKEYPSQFRIKFLTNKSTSNLNYPFNQTGWKILDGTGTVVASRLNNANETTYMDTVNLPMGCYTFVMDDDGCDGISWWANSAGGTGTIQFVKMANLGSVKSFSGDFGCQLVERFTVGYLLNTNEINKAEKQIGVYPNPASDKVSVSFSNPTDQVKYRILDISGKIIDQKEVHLNQSLEHVINTENLKNGVYFLWCELSNNQQYSEKFVIQK